MAISPDGILQKLAETALQKLRAAPDVRPRVPYLWNGKAIWNVA